MDDKNSKGHDHAKVEGERIYHHYSDDQVEAMKENIELNVATRNIRKMKSWTLRNALTRYGTKKLLMMYSKLVLLMTSLLYFFNIFSVQCKRIALIHFSTCQTSWDKFRVPLPDIC